MNMNHALIIEEDEIMRRILKEIFEEKNYVVKVKNSAGETLKMESYENIDIVIMSDTLPDLESEILAYTLRADNQYLPIIHTGEEILEKNRKSSIELEEIDDYIIDPIKEEEVLDKVEKLMARARIRREKKIVIGKVILDFKTSSVMREENRQVLPERSFLLLYKLLSYPDQIFTRIQLWQGAWGKRQDYGWEIISDYMDFLMKTFRDYPEFKIIKVLNLGYKVEIT